MKTMGGSDCKLLLQTVLHAPNWEYSSLLVSTMDRNEIFKAFGHVLYTLKENEKRIRARSLQRFLYAIGDNVPSETNGSIKVSLLWVWQERDLSKWSLTAKDVPDRRCLSFSKHEWKFWSKKNLLWASKDSMSSHSSTKEQTKSHRSTWCNTQSWLCSISDSICSWIQEVHLDYWWLLKMGSSVLHETKSNLKKKFTFTLKKMSHKSGIAFEQFKVIWRWILFQRSLHHVRSRTIEHDLTSCYFPYQNGGTESILLTLLSLTRGMVHQKLVDAALWAESLLPTNYVKIG